MVVTLKKNSALNSKELFALGQSAFDFKESDYSGFKVLLSHSKSYGIFDNKQFASQLIRTSFTVAFNETTYTMDGIGCVATYPNYRGRGFINQLFNEVLQDMHAEGISLTYLAPFSYRFYQKYGYQQCFEKYEYLIESKNFRTFPTRKGYVERLSFSEAVADLRKIFAHAASSKCFGLKRADWWWSYRFEEQYRFLLAFDEGGKAEGYLIYSIEEEKFVIKEWFYCNQNAGINLLNFARTLFTDFSIVKYRVPQNHNNLTFFLKEPFVTKMIVPSMMARIVDLKKFLESYPFCIPETSMTFYLELSDPVLAENNGVWQLNLQSDGQVSVVKRQEHPANQDVLKMEIGTLTQLLLGFRSISMLAFNERIQASKEMIERLNECLPTVTPQLFDFF